MVLLSQRVYRFFRTKRTSFSVLETYRTKPGIQSKVFYATFGVDKSSTTNPSQNNNRNLGLMTMVNRKMSSITLYQIDQSPPARAVKIILSLLDLDVNMEDLNPVSREQDEPEFVKMNPMRTIPILDEGDFSLGDSHAIMIYLVEKYGKAEHSYLYPKDIRKRSTINHVLFFECGLLFPRLRAIMAPTYQGRLTELSKYMKINIDDAYGMLEVYLTQHNFMADDVLTIADFSVYTTTQSLDTLHPVDDQRFPKLKQWLKTMVDLDVIKRVNEPGGSMHGQMLFRIMEINKENQKAKL